MAEEDHGCADLTDSDPENLEWAKSKSKALLRKLLLAKVLPEHLEPRHVWAMHPKTHAKWKGNKYSSFSGGLLRLRNAINRDRGRQEHDQGAFERDLQRLKNLQKDDPQHPVWH